MLVSLFAEQKLKMVSQEVSMKELVEYIAKALVDEVDRIEINDNLELRCRQVVQALYFANY
jgi:hypothetical protein